MARHTLYTQGLKRCFDATVASLALLVFSPVFLVCYFISRSKIGHPVFFRQERPGLNAKPFMLIKFRTMADTRGPDDHLLPDSQRLTPYGKFLRSTSLDELPELWNILKGEMSLVGPRPLLMEYLPRYSAEQARRHELRPGLTGWAQINGRNDLSWPQKFALDCWYADHVGFWLDLKIILHTIIKTIKREGINPANESVMPIFTGKEIDHGEGR